MIPFDVMLRMAASRPSTKEDDRAFAIFVLGIFGFFGALLLTGWLLGRVTFTW